MKFLSKVKDFFNNLKAALLIAIGIALIAIAVGGSIYLSFISLPVILITACGTFLGSCLIVGAFNKLTVSPISNDRIKLQEAESKLDQEEKENQRLKTENRNLNDRLKTHVNITKIQPALQLVTGIVSFDITDYRNQEEKAGGIKKHNLTVDKDKKFSQEKVYYRGVFHCSGDLKLATNLENLQIYVPTDSDEIIIIGDFAYSSSLITETYKKGWLMRGRRETEILRGPDESNMKTAEIKVELGKENENEEKQENDNWDKLSKVADKFDFMKINSDEMIKQLIKIMLQPTGKTVKFRCGESIENPKGQITTLKNYIDEYNLEIDKKQEQPLLSASVK